MRRTWPRPRAMHLVIVALAAPLGLAALLAVLQSGQDLFPRGDHAGLVAAVIRAEHGDQYVGTFSRFGWFHPSPALFYLSVPLYRLLGPSPAGLTATVALINAASVVTIVAVSRRRAGTAAGLVAAVASAYLLAQLGPELLRDYWVPHSVILPFTAFVFVAAAVATGDVALVPLLLAFGSFVAGTNLSSAPPTGVVGIASLAGLAAVPIARRRGGAPRRDWRPWALAGAASLAVLAAFWALPVYQELTDDPGNITQVRRFFDTTAGSHTTGEGMSVLAYVLKAYFPVPGTSFVAPQGATTVAMLFLMLVIALFAVAVTIAFQRRRAFGGALCALALVALAAEMSAVPNIRGDLFGYLVSWFVGIGAVVAAGLALVLGPELRPLAARLSGGRRVRVAAALAATVAALSVYNLAELAGETRIADDAIYAHGDHLRPLYAKLDAWLRREEVSRPLFNIGPGVEWMDGAALASRRARTGAQLAVSGPPTRMFGSDRFPNDAEDADVLITDHAAPPPEGFVVIGRGPDLAVFAHRRPRG